jgi:hypothetical protein
MGWIVAIVLTVLFGPGLVIKAMGYLIQRFKFGVSFKELYAYHKEQDKLEAQSRRAT